MKYKHLQDVCYAFLMLILHIVWLFMSPCVFFFYIFRYYKRKAQIYLGYSVVDHLAF